MKKYFRKHMLKEFKQEQLIINHSFAKECKKHNSNPQAIRLIPISQDFTYSESTIYSNAENIFFEKDDITKKYKNWLKKKINKLNDLQS